MSPLKLGLGGGFGGLEMGLSDGAESHVLHCVGITGSLVFGLSIEGFLPQMAPWAFSRMSNSVSDTLQE